MNAFTAWMKPKRDLKGMALARLALVLSVVISLLSTVHAQDLSFVPEDMAYVPFGVALMGIDKDSADVPPGKEETLFQRRMSMPWSKETLS